VNSFSEQTFATTITPHHCNKHQNKGHLITKQTLTLGAKSNASATGNTAQDSKPMTDLEWKRSHFSYTNEEDMLRAVFGDTDEVGQTCFMCCNLHLPSSDEDSLAKK
jgi:hypothetical protein